MITTNRSGRYYQALVDTKLGPMTAIADENALYLLEFVGCRGLEREIDCLKRQTQSAVLSGITDPIRSIERELGLYFSGQLRQFTVPFFFFGSPFQKRVWEELQKIPFGETRSYAAIASAIGKPSAFRAVANANGANQIAILIPCHRVINTSGALGGYGGGVARKQGLLDLEQQYK